VSKSSAFEVDSRLEEEEQVLRKILKNAPVKTYEQNQQPAQIMLCPSDRVSFFHGCHLFFLKSG